MAKKKVVVKVSNMNGRNSKCWLFPNFRRQDNRLKTLQIAAAVPGIASLSVKGTDQDMIEVIGDGVDAVELAKKLRKSVGHAMLETVDDVKEEKKEEKPKEPPPVVVYPPGLPPYILMEPEPACCTIM
ncbi:hypothetical protein BT93_H1283 [Corymbia citriodora subsp. variegata]|nr:hypothetical protein BT93_H1283 [Corymbia citriodora subsp. variegata]